ncbi:MAG: hypothetical protein GX287_02740 [Fusobacteria bacterium]|nr:hypothetical protein [Fusobacteriota bacterium]
MKISNTLQYNKYSFYGNDSAIQNNNGDKSIKYTDNSVEEENIEIEIEKLKKTEEEVIAHENTHTAVGGKYASAPSYSYTTGPDGKSYINGGEVSIDTSEERTPSDTISKMQIVRAAALAPANPSGQDMAVASKASQIEMRARQKMNNDAYNELNKGKDISVYA